jgi:TFIIF-interacting CTD phosphatase-like protein
LSIYKRPGLDEFLKLLDKDYEPILFASGEKSYVDIVLKVIDPNGIFREVLW